MPLAGANGQILATGFTGDMRALHTDHGVDFTERNIMVLPRAAIECVKRCLGFLGLGLWSGDDHRIANGAERDTQALLDAVQIGVGWPEKNLEQTIIVKLTGDFRALALGRPLGHAHALSLELGGSAATRSSPPKLLGPAETIFRRADGVPQFSRRGHMHRLHIGAAAEQLPRLLAVRSSNTSISRPTHSWLKAICWRCSKACSSASRASFSSSGT